MKMMKIFVVIVKVHVDVADAAKLSSSNGAEDKGDSGGHGDRCESVTALWVEEAEDEEDNKDEDFQVISALTTLAEGWRRTSVDPGPAPGVPWCFWGVGFFLPKSASLNITVVKISSDSWCPQTSRPPPISLS